MKSLVEILKEEYQNYCQDKNIDWLQSVEFAEMRKKRGAECYFVALKNDENIKVAGLISSKNKRFDLVMVEQNGVSQADFVDFLLKSEEFARERGAISYRILPKVVRALRNDKLEIIESNNLDWLNKPLLKAGFKYHSGFKHKFDMDVNMHVYLKDLTELSEDSVASTYNQTTRRNLRAAVKKGVNIRKVEEGEFSDFVAILKSSNQKNGVGTRYEEYYHDLKTCFGERAHFMGVEFEGKLISAGVFIFSKNEVVYFEGGSLQEYRKIPASTFLQDHMIKEAIRAGASKYNFYGITAEPKASLLRFKAGFRGVAVEYAGEYRKRYLFRTILSKILRR